MKEFKCGLPINKDCTYKDEDLCNYGWECIYSKDNYQKHVGMLCELYKKYNEELYDIYRNTRQYRSTIREYIDMPDPEIYPQIEHLRKEINYIENKLKMIT